ncbi:MAG: CBS domain-containing protein [Candidatus Omnitrophica bacterium]|nr:CBS domain-containing protein [Candidatus Omnitrophota bacterium]
MLIKDIMTKKVITVSPEMDIHELAELFMEKNISGAPVVDKSGKLLGVVNEEGVIFQDKKVHLPTFINLSLGFLTLGIKRYNEEIEKITASKVSSIMEKDIVTIGPSTEMEDVATLMIEKEIYYFPVVDEDKLVGVITKKDMVRAIAKEKA